MINMLIEGIVTAISKEFGDNYEIYLENVVQGLAEPCFFIFALNESETPHFNSRYFKRNNFCIHYFPKKNELRSEINGVASRLFNALEYILVKDILYAGEGLKSEVSDGILNFFVSYNFFIDKKYDENPKMGRLRYNQ